MAEAAFEGYLRHDVPAEISAVVTRRPRTAQQDLRRTVYLGTGAAAAAALVLAGLTLAGTVSWHAKYTVDWLLLALLLGGGPYGWFYVRDLKRVNVINDRFPDFLRDLAESARGGMTLPRALQSAAQGQYGVLTPEIRRMSHQVEWGMAFGDAFERFAERTRSPLIERTVNLVQEARRSGGNVVDILTAAAEDAREIKQIVDMRQSQMRAYTTVVYVTFAVFLAVVVLLQAQMVPAFARAANAALESGEGASPSFGGISLDPKRGDVLAELFFHAALFQAVTGGLIAGLLRRGHPVAGLPAIAVMVTIAWVCFRFLVHLLENLLPGS